MLASLIVATAIALLWSGCGHADQTLAVARATNVSGARLIDSATRDEVARLRATALERSAPCAELPDLSAIKACQHDAIDDAATAEAPAIDRLSRWAEAQHRLDDAISSYEACLAEKEAEAKPVACEAPAKAAVLMALPPVADAVRALSPKPAGSK